MSEDIDVVRAARNKLDFASRGAALKAEWLQKGLDKKACWTDKLDRSYDLVSNFCTQWLEAIPEWFVGATGGAGVPGTNNAAEATIKQTRVDAGQVACSVGELLHFILDQVQTASRSEWVSTADRPISARLWLKAAKFQTLFDTDQVRCYEKYSLRPANLFAQGKSIGTVVASLLSGSLSAVPEMQMQLMMSANARPCR